MNFNSAHDGGKIAVINGTARIVEGAPKAISVPAFIAKYEKLFNVEMTPEIFSQAYTVAIRVAPQKLWGF